MIYKTSLRGRLTDRTFSIGKAQFIEALSVHLVPAPQLHRHADLTEADRAGLAAGARGLRVFVFAAHLHGDACFADSTRVAVELFFARVVIKKIAHSAEVFSEDEFAVLAL